MAKRGRDEDVVETGKVDELADTQEVEVPDLGAIARALRATSFVETATRKRSPLDPHAA